MHQTSILGRLGDVLGCLGRVLGRLGGVLGASWWATWLQRGSQNGPRWRQDAPRRPQDAPKTPQEMPKDAPKTPQEVPRSRPRRTKIHPKSILMLKTSKIKNTLKINEKSTKTHHGEASGASRSLRQALRSKNVPRDLCRKAKRAGGNQKEIGASRSISNQVYKNICFS